MLGNTCDLRGQRQTSGDKTLSTAGWHLLPYFLAAYDPISYN